MIIIQKLAHLSDLAIFKNGVSHTLSTVYEELSFQPVYRFLERLGDG